MLGQQESWEQSSVARTAAAFKARVEAEKIATVEAEKRHREQMLKQDLERAQWRVGEIKSRVEELRRGKRAVEQWRHVFNLCTGCLEVYLIQRWV